MSYTIDCEFIAETDKAVRVLCIDAGEKVWFPLAHVEKMEKNPTALGVVKGKITVTDWIAVKRGFDVES